MHPSGIAATNSAKYSRVIDLDVDIGAEAVDYKWVGFTFRHTTVQFLLPTYLLRLIIQSAYHYVYHFLCLVQLRPKNNSQDSRLRCENWKEWWKKLSMKWPTSRPENKDSKTRIVSISLRVQPRKYLASDEPILLLYTFSLRSPGVIPINCCWSPIIYSLVSTNTRVQNFALFSFCCLVALGIWQIFHLRAFFKRKYLID